MSGLTAGGLIAAAVAWPLLFILARLWPEHPEYPWKVKHPREEILTLLWIGPPLGVLVACLGSLL